MDYSSTHPWLTFTADPKSAPPQFWLLLGEAQARCFQISAAPVRPSVAREIGRTRTARGILASAAIAGSTITDDDANRRLEGRLDLAPAQQSHLRDFDNLAAACAGAVAGATRGDTPPLAPAHLQALNRAVLAGAGAAPGALPGSWRTEAAGAALAPGRDAGPPAAAVPELAARLCAWLESERPGPRLAVSIMRALLANLYVEWIRPFTDGNGRTARLLEFTLLVRAGVPEPAAHLTAAHYARSGEEYVRQLERAKRSSSGPVPYMTWVLQGLVDGLRELQEDVAAAQADDVWEAHLEDVFRDRPGKAARRQRQLAADLGRRSRPVPRGRLRSLSPAVAAAYAPVGEKTLLRDLAELAAAGLVERAPDGWLAARRALTPWVRPEPAAPPA